MRKPFPWMSETIDLGKEKTFFESRVTERQGAFQGVRILSPCQFLDLLEVDAAGKP